MRRKAIFFDIDGTLWDEQSRMPESACRAIREMKAAGHAVLICSGRSMGYIFDERLKALDFDGCVSSAGAMVEVGGKTLLCRLASAEDLMNGVNAAKAHRYAPLLEGNSYLYMDREDFIPTAYIDKLYRELDWRIRSLKGTWGEWPDVTKLSMIATAEPAPQAVIDAVRGHWDVIVHAPGLMEMVPPGIDKGTGLKMALEALGISRRDSVAFGDSANDMAMFRESGLNIGMGGGSPALLAKADHVTTLLHEDGIWNAWQWLKERA